MTPNPSPPLRANGDAGGQDISLREVWATLVRSRLLVAGTVVLALAAATSLTWLQDPIYKSQATLRIEENDRGGNVLASISPVAGFSRGKLETEIRVLQSRRIAESVVDSLDLTVRVSEPVAPRDEVLRIHKLGRTGGEGMYELTRRPDGGYDVQARNANPAVRPPRTVSVGAPFTLGTATLSLAPQVARTRPELIRFNINPFRGTVSGLQAGVHVERADPVSHVVVVAYTSRDPQVAADVPNVLAATFLSEKTQGLRAESQSTVRFLREQVASYEEQLKLAEDRLRSFRESQQVVSLPDEASEQVRRLAADQAEHDRLRSEREALAALLAEVTRASVGATQTSPYRRLASFPVF
ncbi:MAG TPA: Wzz/FepE/Etk N-terminal domain-containing protein, partial [Longimicrobium sp.]|nr:Wzz/FepE/Etk N-terminal domain-containing protein [Longimicrobium sp.]